MGPTNYCLVFLFFAGTFALSGQYVPKSFYVIDHNGQKSDVVYIRNRRGVPEIPVLRVRRGTGHSTPNNIADFITSGLQQLNQLAAHIPAGYAGKGFGGGAGAEASSYSFGSGDNGQGFGGGYSSNQGQGFGAGVSSGFANAGKGSEVGSGSYSSDSSGSGELGHGLGGGYSSNYQGPQDLTGNNNKGPVLFSRMGEDYGTGAEVSASAQGPNAAFSFSSTSVDKDGKIKYSVQSGKY